MIKERPPKWADRFLEWYCRPDRLHEIQGDAYELFYRTVKDSRREARLHFIWNVIRFFRWRNIRRQKPKSYSNQAPLSMLQNYFKVGFRNLARHKAFSFINVFGLTIGLTCFMLIASFIYDELSYDKYPLQSKNIYRVGLQLAQNGGIDEYPSVDIAVAGGIKSTFPEVLDFTRISGPSSDYVRNGDDNILEKSIALVDSNFLEFFSLPLVEGKSHDALSEPNSVVISKTFAQKYFGNKSALGEMMTFRRWGLLKVTGVFDEIPDQSHFHFQAVISMHTAKFTQGRQTWSNVGFYSYLLLNEHADVKQLEAKLPVLIEKYVVPEIQEDMEMSLADAQKSVSNWKFLLMPLTDIHLNSHTKYEMEANGDINNVYIFAALAVFILLLACINFMNLSTARSAKRGLEIGVRKALGSLKGQLATQFLVESVILSVIALVFALLAVFGLLPFFNELTGKQTDILFFLSPQVLALMIGSAVLVGIAAGLYPALFLSSVQTLRVLKGNSTGSFKRGGVRSVLVVFQFTVSTALVVATVVAYQQLRFMQNIKLGYDKDQIIVIENASALRENEIPFKQKLKGDHRIVNVTNSSVPIGTAMSFGGTEVFAKERRTSNIHITILSADYDFLETMGMELLIGRNFSREFPSDSLGQNIIINETAMRDLGWNESNVLGSTVVRSAHQQHQVVGVVKDFHYTSAKEKIAPLMMFYRGNSQAMLVKTNSSDVHGVIADLGKQWQAFNVDIPFSYFFLDDRFATLYKSEQTVEKIFISFMIVAVLIACLGLYGLSTHSAEQRIREIGIRKVLGSSVRQIVLLQSKDFLILVVIAIAIAGPISWWAMEQWLQNFGYRIKVNGWIIVISGVTAILIAMVTVSFQAIKSAVANPVKSLRAE